VEGTHRPFWSVMVPVYNRTTHLEKTLASVLAQDPGPEQMQIEVVDDGSTQCDPEPLVRRIADDRVRFVRQPQHLGLVGNFNSCIERAHGHWVHILHTDDYVLPGFYDRMKNTLAPRNDVGAAFCRPLYVDRDGQRLCEGALESATAGVLPDFIAKIGESQRIVMPAIVVRRSVYEHLGGFLPELCYTLDWQMWIRIAAHYPIWYEPEPLAACRLHSGSESSRLMDSGKPVADSRRCVALSRHLLPRDRAEAITREAKKWVSFQALDYARTSLEAGKISAALDQLRQGFLTDPSVRFVKRALTLLAQAAKPRARKVSDTECAQAKA
jgi:hypothetical protein